MKRVIITAPMEGPRYDAWRGMQTRGITPVALAEQWAEHVAAITKQQLGYLLESYRYKLTVTVEEG